MHTQKAPPSVRWGGRGLGHSTNTPHSPSPSCWTTSTVPGTDPGQRAVFWSGRKETLSLWKQAGTWMLTSGWEKRALAVLFIHFYRCNIRHWRYGLNPPRFKPSFSMESVNDVMEKDRVHCVCLPLEVFLYHKASTLLLEQTLDTTSPNAQTHNSGTL